MTDTSHRPVRYLPHAVAATAMMTLAPAAAVWGLALGGVVTDFVPLLAVGLVVSLLVGYGGRALWQERPGSRDLLFSDLMLWNWLRRWRLERRLGDASALLGLDPRDVLAQGDELDPETRIKALKKLVIALEARDRYARGHSRRVARYSTMIAKKLGVPAADVARIRLAATLHDVGKLVVPPALLSKPGRPTEVELGVIKRHALAGADMVSPIGDDELTRIVAHHHERLDGTGYPSQLAKSEIPLGARIIAVADAFDSLSSSRVYKPAQRHRDVFRILGDEMGGQLDPAAVQAFSRSYSGFRGIAAWSIVSGAPLRVLLPVASQSPLAGGTVTAKTLAGLAATAALGSIASGPSPTAPRDASASRDGVPAITASGADLPSVTLPEGLSAGPPVRVQTQGGGPSNGGPASDARGGGGEGNQPDQGGEPSPGGEPNPPPGPGNLPGPSLGDLPAPNAPPIPGNPWDRARRIVERQVGRHGVHLPQQAVHAPKPRGLRGHPLGGPPGPPP